MKKFSKVLCLVLVLAMMAGLCCFGTNAAYADADKITYKEAVDVMSAIGVLQGDANGFRPQDTLTRAEACKIVAALTGSQGAAGTCWFTDAKTHWAADYIGYCAAMGYVNGVGNNKFDPEGTLTGYQFAKMLLCALGYDADIEGLTGAAWEVGVAKLVKSLGLATAIPTFAGASAITREQAALLGFYALQATMVEYGQSQTVSSNGTTSVNTNLKASKISYSASTYTATNDGYLQLVEAYFPLLTKASTVTAFGDPATKWTYGTTVVGTYTGKTPVKTYTAPYALNNTNQVAADLLGYTVSGAPVYMNGQYFGTCVDTTNLAGFLANGRLVEVYALPTGVVTEIVVLDTYLATVTAKDTIKKTVTLTITANGLSYSCVVTGLVGDTNQDFYEELYALNKKDQVLVNVKGTLAASFALAKVIGAPTTVSGAVTAYTSIPETITVAGTKYEAASTMANSSLPGVGATVYTVALDPYGYVIGYATASTANLTYAYVLNKTYTGNPMDGTTYYVQLLLADGTQKWVNMAKTAGKDVAALVAGAYGNLAVGDFVLYSAEGDAYDLVEVAAEWTCASASTSTTELAKNMTSMSVGTYNTSKTEVALTNDTVVLVKNLDGTYTLYKGLANLPTTTDNSVTCKVLMTSANSEVAKMVVVTSLTSVAADAIYVYNTTPIASYTAADGDTVYTYNALVNGELTTVDVLSTFGFTSKILTAPVYSAFGYVSSATEAANTETDLGSVAPAADAIITNLTAGVVAPKIYKVTVNGATRISLDAGVLKIDGITDTQAICNADFTVYDLTTSTATYKDIDATGFAASDNAVVYVAVDANGYATYMIVA